MLKAVLSQEGYNSRRPCIKGLFRRCLQVIEKSAPSSRGFGRIEPFDWVHQRHRRSSTKLSGKRVNQELRRFRCPRQILAQLFESDVIAQLWPDHQDLFGDDAVGPFD
jgi:hypothetical protein